MGDVLEGVASAFRLFKGAMATLSLVIAAASVYGLTVMALSPLGAVQGRLYLRWLANAADRVLTAATPCRTRPRTSSGWLPAGPARTEQVSGRRPTWPGRRR
ncbi:hypothetical protein GCM10020216_097860 [Nonomuraea helvata]